MDINEALRRVLKAAIVADGLVRGLRETAKALDKRHAHLCILATNCEEALYIKLVEALCQEHNISLLKVHTPLNNQLKQHVICDDRCACVCVCVNSAIYRISMITNAPSSDLYCERELEL